MNTQEIINSLKSVLTPDRFIHTMGVAKWARELAFLNGVYGAYTE